MPNGTTPTTRHTGEPIIGLTNAGNIGPEPGTHDVILQALDRWLTYNINGNSTRLYYTPETFKGTEPAWDNTPVIYSPSGRHPDMELFTRNPTRALEEIDGRPAGSVGGTKVILAPGQPRITARVKFTDPEVEELYNAGKLALSTAFFSKYDSNGHLVPPITPNHILVFNPDTAQPRDQASMFLNSQEGNATTNESKLDKVFNDFKAGILGIFNPGTGLPNNQPKNQTKEPDMNNDDTEQKLQLANTALQTKDQELTAAKARITDLETQLTNSKAELDKFRQAESDRTWAGLKNSIIPPGLVKTEEAERELRALYNTDKDGFYAKIMAVKQPSGAQQGSQFTNSTPEAKELAEIHDAWDAATGAGL